MNIYSIKDVKSGFMSLMPLKNDDLAVRSFKNLLNDTTPNLISMNPDDFELWCLGTYNQDSGVIVSDIRFICSSHE